MMTMSSLFSGQRLTEARYELSLTISDLATISDLSRTTISKLENGVVSTPALETVSALSRALKKPVSFFYPNNELQLKNISIPSFRSVLSRSMKINNQSQVCLTRCELIIQCLYNYIQPRNLSFSDSLLDSIDPENLDDDDIEYIAEQVRSSCKIGPGAILKLSTFMENNGIICAPARLPERVDSINVTFKTVSGKTSLVLFNSKLNYFRQRFSLAHEIGHIVLHQNCSKEDFIAHASNYEKQAHRFASAFLMPLDSFRASVMKMTIEGALYLKSQWKVSAQAVIRRFFDTGMIDESRYKYLQMEICRRGWKTREPDDGRVLPEEPYYLRNAFNFIFEKNIATPQDVVDYCSLSPMEICSYVGNNEWFMPTMPNNEFEFIRS